MADKVQPTYIKKWPDCKPAILGILDKKGYVLIPIAPGQKKTHLKDWAALRSNNLKGGYWNGDGGIGIKTGTPIGTHFLIGLDVDDMTGAFEEWAEDLVSGLDGVILRRVGLPPKFLIPARCPTQIPKMQSRTFTRDGQTAKLEILGDGQYFVGYGIHPDTGRAFKWGKSHLTTTEPKDLPIISEAKLKRLIEGFETQADMLGFEEKKNPRQEGKISKDPKGTVNLAFPDWREKMIGISKGYEKRIMTLMGNLLETAEGGRNDALNSATVGVRARLEEASLSDEIFDGKWHYLKTCLEEAAQMIGLDPAETIATIGSGERSGEQIGKKSRDGADEIEKAVTDEFVFCGAHDKFISRKNFLPYSRTGFSGHIVGWNPDEHDDMAVGTWMLKSEYSELERVHGVGWEPRPHESKVDDIIEEDDHNRFLNTWPGFAVSPKEGNVDGWLKVGLRICGYDEDDLQHLIEYCAFMRQHPDKKCNWHPVIVGISGAGKDSFFAPLVRMFGERSAGNIKQSDIGDAYDDAFIKKKLVVMSEASGITAGKMERLKELAASTSSAYSILNEKKGLRIRQKNLWAIIILSNNLNALKLTPNERRFFVLTCDEVMPADEAREFYAEFVESDGGVAAIAHYLDNVDLSKFDPNTLPRRTEAFEEVMEASKSDWERKISTAFEVGEGPFQYDMVLPSLIVDWLKASKIYPSDRDNKEGQVSSFLQQLGYSKLDRTQIARRGVKGKYDRQSRAWLFSKKYLKDNKFSPSKYYTEIAKVEKMVKSLIDTGGLFDD